MKKLRIGLGMAVLLAAASGCGRLDKLVDRQIEEVGTELTGVDVEVAEVDLKLRKASGEITGLTVGNPEGYEAAEAFDMDLLRLNLGLIDTITGKPLVLDELVIDSPVVNLEFNDDGGSNMQDLAQAIAGNQEPADKKSAELKPASKDKPEEPFRIVVHRLVIEGVTLSVRRVDGSERSGTLPAIDLTDVGGDEGKTPAGLATVVIVSLVDSALRQGVAHRLMEGDLFDGERIQSVLDTHLDLSSEQRAALVPVVEDLCRGLNSTVETWVERGFVDLDSLRADFAPVVDDARMLFQEILDSEQMQKLEGLLADLDHGSVEMIRAKLVERLSELLGLTAEQLKEAGPALRQHLERLEALMSSLVNDPDRSMDDFKTRFEAILAETRQALESVLGSEQMQALIERQEQIRETIGATVFSDG